MAIARHKTRQRELRDDRALTRRATRGDRKAFELLYASFEGRLYRVCYRLSGSAVSAAALVEATFTRALADLPEDGIDPLDVGGYLYATARALAYERHSTAGPADAESAAERAGEVVAANRRLAPRQRLTLALRDLEGRPDDELGIALGAETATVPALVARARLRLRAELELPATLPACAARLPELSAYSDATLEPAARPALEVHVAECAHCRAALFALREAKLRYDSLPVPLPPGELGSRMAVALDAVGLAALRPAGEAAPGPGGRQTGAAIAMAALVIVGAGVTIAAWRNGPGGDEPSRAPAPATFPGARASATAGSGGVSSLAAGGRQSPVVWPLVVPPALHHLRSGPRRAPRAIPGPPPNAAAIAPSSPGVPAAASPAGAAAAPAEATKAAPPVPVEILPPSAPPATPTPASAGPQPVAKPGPPQPAKPPTT